MNDHDIFVKSHSRAILFVMSNEDLLRFRSQDVLPSVQRVVHGFGDLKEVVAAGDHVPMGANLQLIQQRYQAVQDLGNSSTDGGGVDHLEGLPSQSGSQVAQLFQLRLSDDARVIFQL